MFALRRYGNIYIMSLVQKHGKQCMACSASFSRTLPTGILSIKTYDFLKQIIILKLYYSVFSPDHVRVADEA